MTTKNFSIEIFEENERYCALVKSQNGHLVSGGASEYESTREKAIYSAIENCLLEVLTPRLIKYGEICFKLEQG